MKTWFCATLRQLRNELDLWASFTLTLENVFLSSSLFGSTVRPGENLLGAQLRWTSTYFSHWVVYLNKDTEYSTQSDQKCTFTHKPWRSLTWYNLQKNDKTFTVRPLLQSPHCQGNWVFILLVPQVHIPVCHEKHR